MNKRFSKVFGSNIPAIVTTGGRERIRGQVGSGLNGYGQPTVTKPIVAIRAPGARDANGTFRSK